MEKIGKDDLIRISLPMYKTLWCELLLKASSNPAKTAEIDEGIRSICKVQCEQMCYELIGFLHPSVTDKNRYLSKLCKLLNEEVVSK